MLMGGVNSTYAKGAIAPDKPHKIIYTLRTIKNRLKLSGITLSKFVFLIQFRLEIPLQQTMVRWNGIDITCPARHRMLQSDA